MDLVYSYTHTLTLKYTLAAVAAVTVSVIEIGDGKDLAGAVLCLRYVRSSLV